MITLVGPDGIAFAAEIRPPRSGNGPGILVLSGADGLDASTLAWCERYAEEGYAVIAPDLARHFTGEGLTADRLRDAVATVYVAKTALAPYVDAGAKTGVLGIAGGAAIAWRAAMYGAVDAAALYGLAEIGDDYRQVQNIACPLAVHVSGDASDAERSALAHLKVASRVRQQLRVYEYPDAAGAFADPLSSAFDHHAADLAHARSLGAFRPVLGPYYDFAELFREHTTREFTDKDPHATMETMVETPYVNHVPTLTGGVGHDLLKRFYTYHFIPKIPEDRQSVVLSETVGPNTVVIEHVSIFTHDEEMDHFLPGIPPTGKRIEIPTVIVAKFRGDKLYHEHIYWDQASVLVQLGLIDAAGLPVAGVEQARKMLDQNQPANLLMDNWKTSEGKPI